MSKNVLFLIMICNLFLLSCQNKSTGKKEYTEIFHEFGFSITSPCKLNDISRQSSGDFLLNYGGMDRPNDKNNKAAYQVIVSQLPARQSGLSEVQLEQFIDNILQKATVNFTNVKAVNFSSKNYPGIVGYTSHQGLRQKGLIFIKDQYIIALTIMTNDNLDSRFEKFTSEFKILENQNESDLEISEQPSKANSSLPCKFENEDFSIGYPATWEIVQQNTKVTSQSTISVQIMDQAVDDNDFASNVNIIVSPKYYKESTVKLAHITIDQFNKAGIKHKLIGIKKCSLDGCTGSLSEFKIYVHGFVLYIQQYIVKTSKNKTFTLTATTDDNNKQDSLNKTIQEIVNSFTVKE